MTDPRILIEAARSVNERIADRAIRHMVFLERLKEAEVRAMTSFLNGRVIPDIERQIEAELVRLSKAGANAGVKLQMLQERLIATNEITRAGMTEARETFAESLRGIARTEAEFTLKMMKDAIPISIATALPSSKILHDVVTKSPIHGRLLGEWFKGLGDSTQIRLAEQLRIHIVQGESLTSGIGRLRGAMDITRRNAGTIVRTSVNNVTTRAREVTYQENSDIIKAVQYIATLDNRTTIVCAGLDGQEFKIDEGPRPPQHMSCRSSTIPVTKSWKELGIDLKDAPPGTRASMNGQVAGKQTYGDWLKRQPKTVQNQVLGKRKARIFRKGKIKIDRFTDSKQRVLSLQELRKLEGLPSSKPKLKPKPKPKLSAKRIEMNRIASEIDRRTNRRFVDAFDDGSPEVPRLRKEYNLESQYAKNLAEEAGEVLGEYTGTGSEWINKASRNVNPTVQLRDLSPTKLIKVVADTHGPVKYADDIVTMEQTIASAPALSKTQVVTRFDHDIGLEIGTEFRSRGFLSTGSAPVESFAKRAEAAYEILVRKGNKGVLTGFNETELEYLFNHGARFRVVGIKQIRFRGATGTGTDRVIKTYQMEYISS